MRRKPPLYRDDLARARNSRRVPTDVERRLWLQLRNRRLVGAKFRRQHPVGPYVVDFFCPEANLVVELDGGGHAEDKEIIRDEHRTRNLESLGLRVLRFWNSDVLQNFDGVLKVIWGALEAPHPNPLPQGEGEGALEAPHPNPLPQGEGEGALEAPHPNPLQRGEETANG